MSPQYLLHLCLDTCISRRMQAHLHRQLSSGRGRKLKRRRRAQWQDEARLQESVYFKLCFLNHAGAAAAAAPKGNQANPEPPAKKARGDRPVTSDFISGTHMNDLTKDDLKRVLFEIEKDQFNNIWTEKLQKEDRQDRDSGGCFGSDFRFDLLTTLAGPGGLPHRTLGG